MTAPATGEPLASFTVYGQPRPQGSHRAFVNRRTGRARVTDDNAGLRSWRQDASYQARRARLSREPETGPIRIAAEFFVKRPTSLPKRVQAATKKPDLDKLTRALCDAMTGIIYADDAQVTDLTVAKRYGEPRVKVEVYRTSGID